MKQPKVSLEELKEAFNVADEQQLQELFDNTDKENARKLNELFETQLQYEELRSRQLKNKEEELKGKIRPYFFTLICLIFISVIFTIPFILFLSFFKSLVIHHTVQCALIGLMGGSGFGLFKVLSDYYFK